MNAFDSPIRVHGSQQHPPQRPQRPQRPQPPQPPPIHPGQNDENHINHDGLRRQLFSPYRPEETPNREGHEHGHAPHDGPPRKPDFSTCDQA